jgi:hypothetical protein
VRSDSESSLAGLRRQPGKQFRWKPSAESARRLRELLGAATARPAAPDWYDIPAQVRKLDPGGARAVIGYGSWYTQSLRKQTSFADVYLVVDDYSRFHGKAFHAWMNHRLPPNVTFIWSHGEGHREIRGKYNVISAADLERECGLGLRDLYNAGRLTKLVWIAWVRDEATREWLITQLVEAHCTLTPLALGLLPERFTATDFSLELLGLSYRGEARLEGWERVRALFEVHADRYRELHGALLAAFADAKTATANAPPPSGPGWPARRGASCAAAAAAATCAGPASSSPSPTWSTSP